MMKLSHDFGTMIQKRSVPGMSADGIFSSSHYFTNYGTGVYNQILDIQNNPKIMSMKDIVSQETSRLLEQQMHLSVWDLANKFERGLSDEAKVREVASLEKHVLLKKLRDSLESLKEQVASKSREDIKEVISMVESLAV